ncbi:MAG: tyrosine-type recombinase/integrase [bacterium]
MPKSSKPIIKYFISKDPKKPLDTPYCDYLAIEKGLSPKTQDNYMNFLKPFRTWLIESNLENLKPSQLTIEHIWKYKVYLAKSIIDIKSGKTLKKTTQNYYLIALRSLLEFFEEKEMPSFSPTKVKLAKDKSDKEIKFLDLKQIEKLFLAPKTETPIGLRDRVILETLFSTGLRVAELARLNREQVKVVKNTKELEIAVIGKGEKIRTVYFSERVVYWLRKYLEKRNDIDEALFINYWKAAEEGESRRLTTKSIEDIVKKYVKIAGLPVMATPHTIRHSFATDLLSNGVDLRLVQEFLGHRNIATTQIYTHVTNKQLRDIHRKAHGGQRLKE